MALAALSSGASRRWLCSEGRIRRSKPSRSWDLSPVLSANRICGGFEASALDLRWLADAVACARSWQKAAKSHLPQTRCREVAPLSSLMPGAKFLAIALAQAIPQPSPWPTVLGSWGPAQSTAQPGSIAVLVDHSGSMSLSEGPRSTQVPRVHAEKSQRRVAYLALQQGGRSLSNRVSGSYLVGLVKCSPVHEGEEIEQEQCSTGSVPT